MIAHKGLNLELEQNRQAKLEKICEYLKAEKANLDYYTLNVTSPYAIERERQIFYKRKLACLKRIEILNAQYRELLIGRTFN